MQKVVVGVGIMWLIVVVGSVSLVYGQATVPVGSTESSIRLGEDLSLTLGLDVWPNQWQTSSAFAQSNARSIQANTAFGVGFIQTATLVYKRLFASISYMRTTNYDFGSNTSLVNGTAEDPNAPLGTPGSTVAVLQQGVTGSRQEGDLTVGYFPLNWLGVAVGYKGVFQDFDINGRFTLPGQSVTDLMPSTSKTRYNGVIFGVLGSARIDDRFTLLGNVFGGYLFISCSPDCPDIGNGSYAASKLVLRYALTPQFSLTLGYRVQIINTSIANDSFDSGHAIDLTHGPILGVNARF